MDIMTASALNLLTNFVDGVFASEWRGVDDSFFSIENFDVELDYLEAWFLWGTNKNAWIF